MRTGEPAFRVLDSFLQDPRSEGEPKAASFLTPAPPLAQLMP